VVGHGLRAGDGARPPWPSGDAAPAMGTSPQRDPPPFPAPPSVPSRRDQPRAAAHRLPSLPGKGLPRGFPGSESIGAREKGAPVGPAQGAREGAGGDVPHCAAPRPGTPR